MQMVSEKDGEDAYREIEGSFDKEHAGHKDRPKLRRVHLSLQYFRYQFGLRARREKLSPVEYRHYLDWAYNILYEVDDSIRALSRPQLRVRDGGIACIGYAALA